MPATTSLPEEGLVHINTVLNVIQIGRSAWYEGVRKGRFPKPVKIGTRSLWRVEDIRALLKQISAGKVLSALIIGFLVLFTAAVPTPVSAGPLVFIDPDKHPAPSGADLTTFFYGTKLLSPVPCFSPPRNLISGFEAREGGPSAYDEAAYGTQNNPHVATTGRFIFAQAECPENSATHTRELWSHFWGDQLTLKFTRLAYSVEADIIFDSVAQWRWADQYTGTQRRHMLGC